MNQSWKLEVLPLVLPLVKTASERFYLVPWHSARFSPINHPSTLSQRKMLYKSVHLKLSICAEEYPRTILKQSVYNTVHWLYNMGHNVTGTVLACCILQCTLLLLLYFCYRYIWIKIFNPIKSEEKQLKDRQKSFSENEWCWLKDISRRYIADLDFSNRHLFLRKVIILDGF